MIFKNEDEAWEYWQDMYYTSGGGYEGTGHSFDVQVDIFKEWLTEQMEYIKC